MKTLDILQVLRFFAAFIVVAFHVQHGASDDFKSVFSLVRIGGSGVDIFFVISGFIITLTVMRKSTFNVPAFALNRFFRIYPTYWLVLTAAILMAVVAYKLTGSSSIFESVNGPSLFVSYLLIPGPGQLYTVAWTLTLEISFYLIFCLSFWIAGLRGVLISLLIWYASTWIYSAFFFTEDTRFIWFFHSVVLEFAYGVIIAWLWLNDRIKYAVPVFCLGVVAFGAVVLGGMEWINLGREFKWGLPAALLIYGAVGIEWKAPRLAVLAGDSSYILYLIHPIVINVVNVLGTMLLGIKVAESNAAALLVVAISVILSLMLTYWVERPYINWYKGVVARLFGKTQPAISPDRAR